MSSRILGFVLVFVMLAPGQAGDHWPEAVKDYFAITKQILSGGRDLFDQLANTQALDVTDRLYSQANDLVIAKTNLRTEFQRSGYVDIGEVQSRTQTLSQTLTRFGDEIDKVSGLTAGDLRSQAAHVLGEKSAELLKIRMASESRDKDHVEMTLKAINAAIEDATRFRNASKCLHDTITAKRATCEATDFQPIKAR